MATSTSTITGLYTTWSYIKSLVNSYNLMLHYLEDSKKYVVYVTNGSKIYKTDLYKSGVDVGGDGFDQAQNDSDRNDFLSNYQPNANGQEQVRVKAEFETNQQVNVENKGLTKKLRYEMLTASQNLSTNSFTSLYNYSGSGKFFGFELQFNHHEIEIKLIIDGEEVIGGVNIDDISKNVVMQPMLLIRSENKELKISIPEGIKYDSSIEIQAQSINNNKKLSLGYVILTKES